MATKWRVVRNYTKYGKPYGYKLKQVCASIDMKRISKDGFPNGIFYYKLHTYDNMEEAVPKKDRSKYISSNKRGRKTQKEVFCQS